MHEFMHSCVCMCMQMHVCRCVRAHMCSCMHTCVHLRVFFQDFEIIFCFTTSLSLLDVFSLLVSQEIQSGFKYQ